MLTYRGGFGLSPTTVRSGRQDTQSAGPSFDELRANPVRGAFLMPATATIALMAPRGLSGDSAPLVTLTRPDGSERVIKSCSLNEGARTSIGIVERGTRVEPGPGVHAQVAVGFCEWATVAHGCC
jgi:hypothetical protein